MTAPNEREMAYIAESLRRLRDHFPQTWSEEGREHKLIGFALYEGSYKDAASGRIIAETAPFALGQELVSCYGFSWVIIEKPINAATYAVQHPNIDEPIDLFALEDGGWHEKDPRDDEPPIPGDRTHSSLEAILKAAELRIRHDR